MAATKTYSHKRYGRGPTTDRKEVALLSEIFNRAIDEEVAFKSPCRKLAEVRPRQDTGEEQARTVPHS